MAVGASSPRQGELLKLGDVVEPGAYGHVGHPLPDHPVGLRCPAGSCGFGCLVAFDPFGGEDWQSSPGHGQVEDRSQRQWRGEPDDLGARRSNRLRLAAIWSVMDVVVLTATTSRRMASSSQ
jgi:hypothetical protein